MTATAAVHDELRRLAALPDADIDLAEAALALASLERPRAHRQRYRAFLAAAADTLTGRAAAAEQAGARAALLIGLLGGELGFGGVEHEADEEGGADLMRVIDRRRGLPVALGILYLQLGRGLGWRVDALSIPPVFLIRLQDAAGQRVMFDPRSGAEVDAAALRSMLKAVAGAGAELEPRHYAAIGNREVLLRLQTHVKVRMIREGNVERALRSVEAMLLLAPDQPSLWREAGMMNLHLGRLEPAAAALEAFVARSPSSTARHRASLLLQELRRRPQ